jgi:hypothetical protein
MATFGGGPYTPCVKSFGLGSFYAVIRGLVLNENLSIADSGGNQVSGCYIGTSGSVRISGVNGSGSLIGRTTPAERNVIATAVIISGDVYPRPQGNIIQGNYIGVSADGGSFIDPGAFVELPPGNYTAILSGKDNSIGVGLIEVYHLP